MSEVEAALVAWLAVYTYPVAGLTVLIGAIGIPVPTSAVVLAAGAISNEGEPDFWILFGLILAAAVLGDATSYSLGRWASHLVLGRVGLTPTSVEAAERHFVRWGGLLVLVTRFLLTGLALPTNLAAGASTYPLARFLAYAVVGEAIWTGQLLTLGWLFGPSWVTLLDYLGDVVLMLTMLAIAVVLGVILVRLLHAKPV